MKMVMMPEEATDAMMDAAIGAARGQPSGANGQIGHRQMRAAYWAFRDAFEQEVAASLAKAKS